MPCRVSDGTAGIKFHPSAQRHKDFRSHSADKQCLQGTYGKAYSGRLCELRLLYQCLPAASGYSLPPRISGEVGKRKRLVKTQVSCLTQCKRGLFLTFRNDSVGGAAKSIVPGFSVVSGQIIRVGIFRNFGKNGIAVDCRGNLLPLPFIINRIG